MKRSPRTYVVVLVTCGSPREASRIAPQRGGAQAGERRVSIIDTPVRSVYRWKRKIEQGREFLLVIKEFPGRARRAADRGRTPSQL